MRSLERLVLNFHGIATPPVPIPVDERPYWCSETVFYELLDSLEGFSKIVPIELTFDDGNLSDVSIALPALKERGLTASFFVCAGRLGSPGYLAVDDVRILASSGMEVGSHGWDHIDWCRADDATLEREMDGARERLEEVVGSKVDSVAIPFGSYDARVLRLLRRRTFRRVYTSDGCRPRLTATVRPRETYQTWWSQSTLEVLATRPTRLKLRLKRYAVNAFLR